MTDAPNYLVTVLYREPLFERSIGRRGPPYRWTFELQATSRALAIEEARRRFEACRLESSVGWEREVVGWEVDTVVPQASGRQRPSPTRRWRPAGRGSSR